MFAVIKTGGKQYRVMPGDILTVEKLPVANGDHFDFTEVLMLSDGKQVQLGTPVVDGAVVKGRVINQERGDKVIVFKKKRRHNYRRKNGHRQYLTAIQIVEIAAKGMSGKAEKLLEPKPVKTKDDATVVEKVTKKQTKKASASEKTTVKAEKPAKVADSGDKKAAAGKKAASGEKEAKPKAKSTTATKKATTKKS